MWVQSLALLSRLRIWHCRDLWCRPAAVAPIRPLAWEPPYAVGVALKNKIKSLAPVPNILIDANIYGPSIFQRNLKEDKNQRVLQELHMIRPM